MSTRMRWPHQPTLLPKPWTTKVKAQLSVATVLLSAVNNWLVWRRNSFRRTTSLARVVVNSPLNSACKNPPSKSGSKTDAWRTNVNACRLPGPSLIPCSPLTFCKPLDTRTHCHCPVIRLPVTVHHLLDRWDPWPITDTLPTELFLFALIHTVPAHQLHRPIHSLLPDRRFAPAPNYACPAIPCRPAARAPPARPALWLHCLLKCHWLHQLINYVCQLPHRLWPTAELRRPFLLSTTVPINRATAASHAIALTVPTGPSVLQSHRRPLKLRHRPTLLVFSSPTNCTTCRPRKPKSEFINYSFTKYPVCHIGFHPRRRCISLAAHNGSLCVSQLKNSSSDFIIIVFIVITIILHTLWMFPLAFGLFSPYSRFLNCIYKHPHLVSMSYLPKENKIQ